MRSSLAAGVVLLALASSPVRAQDIPDGPPSAWREGPREGMRWRGRYRLDGPSRIRWRGPMVAPRIRYGPMMSSQWRNPPGLERLGWRGNQDRFRARWGRDFARQYGNQFRNQYRNQYRNLYRNQYRNEYRRWTRTMPREFSRQWRNWDDEGGWRRDFVRSRHNHRRYHPI